MSEHDHEHCHFDCHPGLTMEGIRLEQRTQPDGVTKYWHAEQDIGSIFGSEVEGSCEGMGTTKEAAIEKLKEAVKRLHESLWA